MDIRNLSRKCGRSHLLVALLLGLMLFTGTVEAAPPPPEFAAQVLSYLTRDLPPDLPIRKIQTLGDSVTVCLDVLPERLRSDGGIGAESVAQAVRQALTPLPWRALSVQAWDSETERCRPLSDFLPRAVEQDSELMTQDSGLRNDEASAGQGAPTSLAGKTIYVSAGHGWQWGKDYSSTSPATWRTQRGIYEDIIEDHNNAEVVNQYLIPYLEQAGATVIPVRERDWNSVRVIADNDAGSPTYRESGAWVTSVASGYAGGTYRLATTVSGTATATATWAFDVSEAGAYALYAWVRSLSNRAPDAHYTVHHAAGASEVFLDQRVLPETWRYLGTFPFYAGTVTVTLDNASSVAGATVMADAVRLGGGTFDDLTGIETLAPAPPYKPWWESDTEYYSQWMGLEPDDWPYFNDVVARPMYARWNHAGGAEIASTDAVYISWHTNGYNGTVRGTESYVHNGETYTRTEGSLDLQQAVHDELIHDILVGWDPTWADRGKKQANLGEVRMLWDDDPVARMPGVLLEIAFHDHPEDTNALKDPRFAELTARAVYQGILHYFEARDGVDMVELPEPPTHARVTNLGNGAVQVAWSPSPTDAAGLFGDAADGYHVYTSPDGFAWRAPVFVSKTSYTLAQHQLGQTVYVRVTAVNAGGESFPTEVLGARVGSPTLLLVNGFDKLTRFGLPVDDDTLVGPSHRLWLDQLNSHDYVVHHGDAVPLAYAWDSASNEAVVNCLVPLDTYPLMDWILGEESTEVDGSLNTAERAALQAFLQNEGALLISGSEFAWDLEDQGRDPVFLNQQLRTDFVADDAGTYAVTPLAGSAFASLPGFTFDAPGEYDVDYADVLAPYPASGASSALSYIGGVGGTAAIQYAAGCQRLLVLGFPLETVRPASRDAVMAAALDFLDECVLLVDTAITSPQAGAYYSVTPEFEGTASGSILNRVEVQIQRERDTMFWSGVAWHSVGSWLTATGTSAWAYVLPALTDSVYTVRARAVADQPDLTPAEVNFVFDATPPLTPTLITPTGGVLVTGPQVVLRWKPPEDDDPLTYEVWLDGEIYSAVGTAYTATLFGGGATLITGPYQWRVRALDAARNIGPWSESALFVVAELVQTTISTPQVGAYYSVTPPFSGTASGIGLRWVEVQLQRQADCTFWNGTTWQLVPAWLTATGTLVWSYDGLPGALPGDGNYVARARSVEDWPDPTPAEAAFVYDATKPLTPTLVAPLGTISILMPVLRWQMPLDESSPLSYHLNIDGEHHTVTGMSYVASLTPGSHQWRVRAVDAAGNFGPWSGVGTFYIEVQQLYLPLILRNCALSTEDRCSLLLDSGFETAGDWVYNARAIRVSDVVHDGTYAARVGIPPDMPGEEGFSSVAHSLILPGDADSVTLRLWVYPVAEETGDDYHYFILRDMENEAHVLSTETVNDCVWQTRTFDLSAYIGQSVTLFFGVRNDGDDETAALYLDDVQVEVCR